MPTEPTQLTHRWRISSQRIVAAISSRSMALSRGSVLRVGYVTVLALMVFLSVQAYRIQDTLSALHVDVYRNYNEHEEAIAELRRTMWLATTAARDYFINTVPETSLVLESELRDLKVENQRALNQLKALNGFGGADSAIDKSIQEFWSTVDSIPGSMLHASSLERYQFVRKQMVPRRSTLFAALRELSEAGHRALEKSEADLSETRRAAAWRMILVLALCVIIGMFVARLSLVHAESLERAADQQYRETAQAKRHLEQLSERLVEVEEEGRKRLSRELHDGIGQGLGVLQLELSTAGALPDVSLPAIREHLGRARQLARHTSQTVRDMSLMLRPTLLDDLGLVPALQWLGEDFTRRSGILWKFSPDGVEDGLPDSVKTCVFRVVQEALHNSEKHAAASVVSAFVHQSFDVLVAEIEDNGRGFEFDPMKMQQRNGGLGILGMHERALRLGGSLTLDSAPGRGTRVSLTIPVPKPALELEPAPDGGAISYADTNPCR